jgi:N-acetylglucosamine kinase-like BadF-type ATPase
MDISGLHFDAVVTHAVFELKEDGNYYSRDILFNSARDTDNGIDRRSMKKTVLVLLRLRHMN